MAYSVAIAGTTSRTTLCAQALKDDDRFDISLIISPEAKPIGRKKIITPNPMQVFAQKNKIETVFVKSKIDEVVKKEILSYQRPDFLLVVDFGYFIPEWLLEFPEAMPLNIHPSQLPRWRGSSPGQFVLLNGEKDSAVSIIKMTPKFDQGPIVAQYPFQVQPSWTQTEYYQHSFELASQNLVPVMLGLASGKITPIPQPEESSTPLAKRLTKTDAFVDWSQVMAAIKSNQEEAISIERASKAYSPWPMLWTIIETAKGQKRMQIIKTNLNKDGLLNLDQVKIEGMAVKPWVEVKNVV